MTIKYMKDFEHPTGFGFTGSSGKAHVKPHIRKQPTRRAKEASLDPQDLPMQPLIPPLARR